jgi:PAS domain S-box-containing protein
VVQESFAGIQEGQSKARLDAILENIIDGLITIDEMGIVQNYNRACRKIFGYEAEEVIGKNVSMLMPAEYATHHDQCLQNYLETGNAKIIGIGRETEGLRKDGTTFPIDLSVAEVRLGGGARVFSGIVRDITERKVAEELLRDVSATLKRSNEELQHFVDAAAHDLRSPLNSVSVGAQLLTHQFIGKLDPKGDETIGVITRGVDSMKRLLEDLVVFAKASHFDAAAERPISAELAFRSALENLNTEVERFGAQITSGTLPMVVMHETHLLQLFQNLIGNALKYHGQQQPRIHVSAEQRGTEWLISVADNGIGIAPEYAEKIFQPFTRLHGYEYPGTGIGLATCQKIVAGYGKRIWVQSELGKGSVFFFTLPVAEEGQFSRRNLTEVRRVK